MNTINVNGHVVNMDRVTDITFTTENGQLQTHFFLDMIDACGDVHSLEFYGDEAEAVQQWVKASSLDIMARYGPKPKITKADYFSIQMTHKTSGHCSFCGKSMYEEVVYQNDNDYWICDDCYAKLPEAEEAYR